MTPPQKRAVEQPALPFYFSLDVVVATAEGVFLSGWLLDPNTLLDAV